MLAILTRFGEISLHWTGVAKCLTVRVFFVYNQVIPGKLLRTVTTDPLVSSNGQSDVLSSHFLRKLRRKDSPHGLGAAYEPTILPGLRVRVQGPGPYSKGHSYRRHSY